MARKFKKGFGKKVSHKGKKHLDISEYKGIRAEINIDGVITKNAERLVAKLKETSPRGARFKNSTYKANSYAEGWTYTYSPYNDTAVVYNATNYRLTHLLEYGHVLTQTKDLSKKTWVAPRRHIIPAFNAIEPKFVKEMYEADINIEFI